MANATQLSPAEVKFRYDGLTSLFDLGLDFWWYDENWHDIIPGLSFDDNGQIEACPHGKCPVCAYAIRLYLRYLDGSLRYLHAVSCDI